MCTNPLSLWEKLELEEKKVFQNLLFPEGITYNRELDKVRTSRMNIFFSIIPELTGFSEGYKKRDSIKNDEIPPLVPRTGFEPMTYCLEGSCSIQLSYRGILKAVAKI